MFNNWRSAIEERNLRQRLHREQIWRFWKSFVGTTLLRLCIRVHSERRRVMEFATACLSDVYSPSQEASIHGIFFSLRIQRTPTIRIETEIRRDISHLLPIMDPTMLHYVFGLTFGLGPYTSISTTRLELNKSVVTQDTYGCLFVISRLLPLQAALLLRAFLR